MIFEHNGKVVCRFSGTKSGNEIKSNNRPICLDTD